MFNLFRSLSLLTALAAVPAFANLTFSGNPSADGWLFSGNSTTLGTYIQSTNSTYPNDAANARFQYNAYSYSYTLTAGDTAFDANWQPGDLILGLGGDSTDPISFSPHIVAKFGSSSSEYSAASVVPCSNSGGTCGNSQFGMGQGGTGSVLVGLAENRNGTTIPGAGTIQTPTGTNLEYWNGISVVDSGSSGIDDYGRVLFLTSTGGDGQDLDSWEVLLDVTGLERFLNTSVGPGVGDISDMAIQESTHDSLDALIPSTGTAAVPEPGTITLLAAGLTLVAFRIRRTLA